MKLSMFRTGWDMIVNYFHATKYAQFNFAHPIFKLDVQTTDSHFLDEAGP